MSYSNQGTQTILSAYNSELTAKFFNKLYRYLFTDGVYNGFALTVIDDTHVQIGPGTLIIYDTNYTVNVNTESSQIIEIDSSNPYVICSYEFKEEPDWYADFSAVSYATAHSTYNVILGRALYDGSTLEGFDLSVRKMGNTDMLLALFNNFRVIENNSYGVIIEPGEVTFEAGIFSEPSQTVIGPGQTLEFDSADPVLERWDIVAINNQTFDFEIIKGEASASPALPLYAGYLPLAYVTILPGLTKIFQQHIVDMRPFLTSPSNFSILNQRGFTDSDLKNTTVDYNTLVSTGFYYNTSPTNSPNSSSEGHFLLVQRKSSLYSDVMQIATTGSGMIYSRTRSSLGVWSSWSSAVYSNFGTKNNDKKNLLSFTGLTGLPPYASATPTYNAEGILTKMEYFDNAGSLLITADYTFTTEGNIESIVYTLAYDNNNTVTKLYTYEDDVITKIEVF